MKAGFFNTGFPKVTFAFGAIILIVLINVGLNFIIIRKNKASVAEMTDVINPYIENLEKFNLLVTESKMYATNWVFLSFSKDDKDALDSLQKFRYPQLKKELLAFMPKLKNKADSVSLADVFKQCEELEKIEKEQIMQVLLGLDDYNNGRKKLGCESVIEEEVLPRSQLMMSKLSGIIQRNRDYAVKMKSDLEASSFKMMAIMLGASVGLFFFILFTISFISRAIRKPVVKMKTIIQQLSKGELPEEKIESQKNVIGEMGTSVNALSASFKNTSLFANEIGKGNLTVPYEKLGENDLLGNALIHMRDSLKVYAEDMESKVSERTKEVIEKGVKLESAYREIRESIHYAKRIQESILPADEIMTRVFADSFIFYRPKDIVCGDFYWFTQQEDDFVVAAIDCTGHGVPGALMTVIGNSIFNQVVNFGGVTDPAKILTQVDKKLMETLKQHGNITTNDGMDAAICRYRIVKREITFAGAKRPMYMYKGGELIEIKGNKSPIGSFGHDFDKRFTEQKFTMNKGDSIYLFSDG
ncbi:MAG: SpoIIE family protein phosphatase, partial [Bacteroidia bacterium]|nr:SpoIIE family protein phosphatase [Bacteroidia bacterium]